MPTVNRLDAERASIAPAPHHEADSNLDDGIDFGDFEAEMQRLSAANAELMRHLGSSECPDTTVEGPPNTEGDELALLRLENAELKARLQELEAVHAGHSEELWLERQREYEALLEEKSEVIRSMHQKIQEIQEIQESAIGSGDSPPANSTSFSGTRLGHAEEILRLKREMDDQRRQLERDEEEMMGQMRQMEMTMARERAEMARQRQEMQRLQNDLAREIENSSRDPELRDRLQSLRRIADPKQLPVTTPLTGATKPTPGKEPQSSGLLRRLFG